MVKGIVLLDNKRWGVKNLFRRVTASFSGVGIGLDTFDVLYNDRL